MNKPPKPTAKEMEDARNAMEAELEKLGRGDGSTTAERVKYLADLLILMERRFRDDSDA